MNSFARLQTFAADRGWGQYPLPRSRPRYSRGPGAVGLRLVAGTLGLFGIIVLGIAAIVLAGVFGVFVYAAFTS